MNESETTFDDKNGIQTMTIMRTNAGLQKIKAGGAIFSDLFYLDGRDSMHASSYLGFANDPTDLDEETEDDADDCDGEKGCVDDVSSTVLAASARDPIAAEATTSFDFKSVTIGAAVGVAMAMATAAVCR